MYRALRPWAFASAFCKRSLLPPVDSALRPWAFASTFASVYCCPHLSAPRDHLPLRGPTATPKFRLQGREGGAVARGTMKSQQLRHVRVAVVSLVRPTTLRSARHWLDDGALGTYSS